MREVGTGARAIFEQTGFTHPKVHNAAFIHQIVRHGLDEAGMRLRMLIGRLGLGELAGFRIDIEMPLRRAINAIGPMQTRIEPLRAVGSAFLGGEHEAKLVIKGARIFFSVKIAALPAPIGPGACQAVENLLGGHFAGLAIFLSNISQSGIVHFGLPQPARHVVFFNLLQRLGNARAAEILLGQNVRSHLAPTGGNLDIGSAENDGTIGILDFAGDQTKFNGRIRRLASFSITALNAHDLRSLFPNPNKPLLAQKP